MPSGAWCNGFSQGCAVGDFDADGFPDLFIAQVGPDVLLHNNGDGTFTEVTANAGTTDDLWSSSAAWFDAGGLLAELRRRVAYRTESQDRARASELARYLTVTGLLLAVPDGFWHQLLSWS